MEILLVFTQTHLKRSKSCKNKTREVSSNICTKMGSERCWFSACHVKISDVVKKVKIRYIRIHKVKKIERGGGK